MRASGRFARDRFLKPPADAVAATAAAFSSPRGLDPVTLLANRSRFPGLRSPVARAIPSFYQVSTGNNFPVLGLFRLDGFSDFWECTDHQEAVYFRFLRDDSYTDDAARLTLEAVLARPPVPSDSGRDKTRASFTFLQGPDVWFAREVGRLARPRARKDAVLLAPVTLSFSARDTHSGPITSPVSGQSLNRRPRESRTKFICKPAAMHMLFSNLLFWMYVVLMLVEPPYVVPYKGWWCFKICLYVFFFFVKRKLVIETI